MATIEERLAALEALLGMSEGETPYVSQYSGPDIDEGVELARSGTVRKTGDTMTGNLTIQKASFPQVVALNTGTGRAAYLQAADDNSVVMQNRKDSTNRTSLILHAEAGGDSGMLRLYRTSGDGAAGYKVYHEGNKPDPAAIGAVAKAGDTMTGWLNFKQAENGYSSIFKNNTHEADYGSGFYDYSNSGALVGLNLSGQGQTASLSFSSGAYDILHTGNMDSLISSLRIATGTYTGTGTYGGSVTLTCGFKPAFAIIYRPDTVIGATSVPIDTNVSGVTTVYGDWSGDFAILVPTAKGIRVAYNNTVTVESGNTYLKFTPSGTELNSVITYNYIIVGS